MAPQMCRSANRPVEPEVWFRVVHLAKEGLSGAPVGPYREQMVEIALGLKAVPPRVLHGEPAERKASW